MHESLSCWTPRHGQVLVATFIFVPTLAVGVGLPDPLSLGITLAVYGYWYALGALNRWQVRASPAEIRVWCGPLPWFWASRRLSPSDVVGFLSHGDVAEKDRGELEPPLLLRASFGIDVLHPNGQTSALVRGCGDGAEVARVRQGLEAYYRR